MASGKPGEAVAASQSDFVYKTLETKGKEVGGGGEEAIITELKRATQYEIVVQAFNSKGAGPASEATLVTTSEFGEFGRCLWVFNLLMSLLIDRPSQCHHVAGVRGDTEIDSPGVGGVRRADRDRPHSTLQARVQRLEGDSPGGRVVVRARESSLRHPLPVLSGRLQLGGQG